MYSTYISDCLNVCHCFQKQPRIYYSTVCTYTNIYNILAVFTGPPALTVKIMKKIDNLLIVVWDKVDDSLNTTYEVTWGSNKTQSHTLTKQSSCTITGLTLDTVYNISVTASNRCGTGPEYSTTVILTSDTTSATLNNIIPTATASTDITNPIMSTTNPSTTATTTTSMQSSLLLTTIATATATATTTNANANTTSAMTSTSNVIMYPDSAASNTMTTVSGDANTPAIITTTSMSSSTSSGDADTTKNVTTTSGVSSTSITNSADKTMTGKFLSTKYIFALI